LPQHGPEQGFRTLRKYPIQPTWIKSVGFHKFFISK
jgi:hypothetical protein